MPSQLQADNNDNNNKSTRYLPYYRVRQYGNHFPSSISTSTRQAFSSNVCNLVLAFPLWTFLSLGMTAVALASGVTGANGVTLDEEPNKSSLSFDQRQQTQSDKAEEESKRNCRLNDYLSIVMISFL